MKERELPQKERVLPQEEIDELATRMASLEADNRFLRCLLTFAAIAAVAFAAFAYIVARS